MNESFNSFTGLLECGHFCSLYVEPNYPGLMKQVSFITTNVQQPYKSKPGP